MIPNPHILNFALSAHADTNHKYDNKPYAVHLGMVVAYAYKYIHLIPKELRLGVIHACWLHDTIEDCRMTFNDIKKIAGEKVANIVYAVSNEKGHNRQERASHKYYQGIRDTPGAIFVKLCDRLANVSYGYQIQSPMLGLYHKEHSEFIDKLFIENVSFVGYISMVEELADLLHITNE